MAPIVSRMTTLSDDGDRLCPLCAEEMDLTDQQLKPCKCGYEICVWCWHHIMEMAEKENAEGRCPACRTPYDKERIAGMAVNCERLMADMNGGKRHRSQKGKPKVSVEDRKHLSTVRVVQRNLVYIIGIPINLCDESLLERKEYFGQYGEILKVSISRSASTTNQQASNSNVYITYSREEDAVRCIQSVHNYLLAGKRLRACFGTTKYCHAWLRNMNCSNPDCLYLHDIGSQEDSFTKDEVISSYTRNGVAQVPSSNLQKRSGSLLPPPTEELESFQALSCKQLINNAAKATESLAIISKVNSEKHAILPAASSWGSCASNATALPTNIAGYPNSMKLNVEIRNNLSQISNSMDANELSSAWHDDEVATPMADEGHSKSLPSEPSKFCLGKASPTTASDLSSDASDMSSVTLHFDAHGSGDSAWDDDSVISSKFVEENFVLQTMSSSTTTTSAKTLSVDSEFQTSGVGLLTDLAPDKTDYSSSKSCPLSCSLPVSQDIDVVLNASGGKKDAVSLMADESLNKHSSCSCVVLTTANEPAHTLVSSPANMSRKIKRHPVSEQKKDAFVGLSTMMKSQLSSKERNYSEGQGNLISSSSIEVPISLKDVSVLEASSLNLEFPKMSFESDGVKDTSLAVVDIKQIDSVGAIQTLCSPHYTCSLSNGNQERSYNLTDFDETTNTSSSEEFVMHINTESSFDRAVNTSNGGIRFLDSFNNFGRNDKDASVHTKEDSIIADILSLDFDPWNDSTSLTNDLSMLLSKNEGQNSSVMHSRSPISQIVNQSRFSFARQEDQTKLAEPSVTDIEHMNRGCTLQYSCGKNLQYGLSVDYPYSCSSQHSDRPAGISRLKMSAPPGFSMPSRPAPPGFSAQDRYDQNFMAAAAESRLCSNTLFRNQHEVHSSETSGDVEFNDPAILAVGKDHMPLGNNVNNVALSSAFPARFRSEGNLIHQLLTKQSGSTHQNTRISDPVMHSYQNMRISESVMDGFLPLNDSYFTYHNSSSPMLQFSSPILNSHWDGWNSKQSNTAMSMAEGLKNESFGLNNSYIGKAEYRFHIPSSGNVYSRAFGM